MNYKIIIATLFSFAVGAITMESIIRKKDRKNALEELEKDDFDDGEYYGRKAAVKYISKVDDTEYDNFTKLSRNKMYEKGYSKGFIEYIKEHIEEQRTDEE